MTEAGENADQQHEGGIPPGSSASEDAELLAALETLRRVVNRPKRAPRGTNDVWGWSTGQEHALEPGTEPRDRVVARIKKSYQPDDGTPASSREAKEVAVLETIAHVIDAMKDRPEYAKHDLKRIVKALETVIADKVGPGDAPPEPSKMLVAPGTRSAKDLSQELALPVLTPEEETMDYSYIVSDHPAIAQLVQEHGLTTVWSELLRLRFELPITNKDIASTLSKVTMVMDGSRFDDMPPAKRPKMHVDEKGEPVMYDRSRSTDIFPLDLYWQDVKIVEKEETLQSLEDRVDRSGGRGPYSSIRTLTPTMDFFAGIKGDRALWLELMRIRYGVWTKDEDARRMLLDTAETHNPGMLSIPPGEEAVPARLIADVRLELRDLYKAAHKLEEANKLALERRKLLESGKMGQFVRLSPWNTYVRLDSLTAKMPGASAEGGAQSAVPEQDSDKARRQIESIQEIANEELPAPAAGMLADALRIAAKQLDQQSGIAAVGSPSDAQHEVPKATDPHQQTVRELKDEGLIIRYLEGRHAQIQPIWGPDEFYFREMIDARSRESYQQGMRRIRQGETHLKEEYKDGKRRDRWHGLHALGRLMFWDALPAEGKADPNHKYYPFTTEYVDFIKSMRDLANDTFKNFREAEKIRSEKGFIGVLRQKWKDSVDGLELRIWTGHQMFVWINLVNGYLLESPANGRPNWDVYNRFKSYEPAYIQWNPDGGAGMK